MTTRRDFGRAVALAAAPLLAGTADAADKREPADPRKAIAEALMEIVNARYGKFLTEAQKTALQRRLAGRIASAEAMKKVPLKNSDDPAFAFRADLP